MILPLVLWLITPVWAAPAGADVEALARLPVLHEGRVKPWDTLARSSLLMLRGRQSLRHEGRRIAAAEWLLDAAATPEKADAYPIFRVDDPELLAAAGLEGARGRSVSFNELLPRISELETLYAQAEAVEASRRSRFQRAAFALGERVVLYQRLKNSLRPAEVEDLPAAVAEYAAALGPGRRDLSALHNHFLRWDFIARAAAFSPLPPLAAEEPDSWRTLGGGLLDAARSGQVHPAALGWARIIQAWRRADPAGFHSAVTDYRSWLDSGSPGLGRRAAAEARFNRLGLFYLGMGLYLLAGLLAAASWLADPREILSRGGRLTLWAGLALHTAGLACRVILEGRPPVTNLYSSAVFTGWVAALLAAFLERQDGRGLGAAAGGVAGFASLLIAHHLSLQGDTLEMMRAVLDSNFWLATHVVAITVGYGASFLAGLLAHFYILRAGLTRSLDDAAARRLAGMVYGVVCFSLFFSFIGTVLGGIWADQSWGRFWGWDPKENGALLIVLWQALILHARWGGLIRDRGLMVMAVFGNVVTAFSWFGVNMLAIGLHSYGFMDDAFRALALFAAAQAAVMALGLRDPKSWRGAQAL